MVSDRLSDVLFEVNPHRGYAGEMGTITRSRSDARQRRDRVEQQVLDAVDALLDEGASFTEIPVARIAERARIARSTFYRYFPDKTQLLINLGTQASREMFDAAIEWWRGDHRDGPAGATRAVERMIDGFRAHERILLALIEVAGYEAEVAEFWHGRVHRFVEIAAERLESLARAGEIAPDVDPGATAAALTFMVERTIPRQLAHTDRGEDRRLAAALGRSIWLTVYGRC